MAEAGDVRPCSVIIRNVVHQFAGCSLSLLSLLLVSSYDGVSTY